MIWGFVLLSLFFLAVVCPSGPGPHFYWLGILYSMAYLNTRFYCILSTGDICDSRTTEKSLVMLISNKIAKNHYDLTNIGCSGKLNKIL